MALTTTTLSSAVTSTATSIVVTSATGFAAGNLILVDLEWMQVAKSYVSGTTIPVLRGQDGSVQVAHVASANVTTGLTTDFNGPAPMQVVSEPQALTKQVQSYSASGAISFSGNCDWTTAILNGTSALSMTLANPTKDMDGQYLHIVANGKAAHTVTYTAGLGNGGASYDVGTFSASLAMSSLLVACNGFWVSVGPTGATAMVGSPAWA